MTTIGIVLRKQYLKLINNFMMIEHKPAGKEITQWHLV